MPKNKISEYSSTAGDNTDIGGINIAEGMAPSDVNNAMREQMAQLKKFLDGSSGDTITSAKIVATTAEINSTATFNGPVIMSSSLSVSGNSLLKRIKEGITIAATAAANTINFDFVTQSVLYYTTNASGNWALNVRGDSGTTLNSLMATGESATLAFLATQGSTPYYQTTLQVDGSTVSPKWQGGTAPTAGNASSIDAYTVTLIKTADATFTALASQTKFA